MVITPLLAILMHIDLYEHLFGLSLLLSLSAIGFAFVGTPLAVMAVGARFPEVLLPMVVFPRHSCDDLWCSRLCSPLRYIS